MSKVRPKDTMIDNRFESGGILPFMKVFNLTTKAISQSGNRNGALLTGTLSTMLCVSGGCKPKFALEYACKPSPQLRVCPAYAVRSAMQGDTSRGSCCPVAVGNALLEMWEEINCCVGKEEKSDSWNLCPVCGGRLIFERGCNSCKDCGWSKCR